MKIAAKRRPGFSWIHLTIVAILIVATWLRLRGLGFGLPALYDRDEPLFVLTALKLLRGHTLNPGWFGHPGSTTIYALALIDVLVVAIGLMTGRFADIPSFARAVYGDPSIIMLPGRCFIVVCALATILLTFLLARRMFGDRAGVLAAAILAIDPIHIKYSQIIRTDMHETVFLLLCVLASVNIARRGRVSDYVWAAIWLGLAVATKWPAVTVASSIAGASCYRMTLPGASWRQHLGRLAMVAPVALAALLIASPFLLLDFHTVIANVSGEARTHHPGATGHGFVANFGWYLAHPLTDALGAIGLGLAGLGLVVGSRRSRAFAVTVVPLILVSLVAVSLQALIWERWMVPLLPFASIAVVAVLDASIARFAGRLGRFANVALLVTILVPAALAEQANATERARDTRAEASRWFRQHVPRGSSVLIEQLALDLLMDTGWRFIYPVGDKGCIDVAAALRSKIPYTTVERWRNGRAVIDFGTMAPAAFPTCRAQYAIISDYDRYLPEADRYAQEVRLYQALFRQGRVLVTFRPVPEQIGGPIVRILLLDPQSPGWSLPAAPKPIGQR